MKIRFIVNPVAGTGKQKQISKIISKYIKNYDITYTKKTGDAKNFCQKAIIENFDAVVAIGGDGTVNECLKGLVNSELALGVIPCGSGNGFARHIGMSNNIIKSIKQIQSSKIESIDYGRTNNMPFLNVSGVGFDAHISKLFLKIKKRGILSYIKIIVKELKYKSKKYELIYDDKNEKVNAFMISFANASQYGNNAKISPMASIKDGKIDFVIVNKFPKWKIPFFVLKMILGTVHLSKYVKIIRTNKMIIKSNGDIIHLDGEPQRTKNPIKIVTYPKAFKILIPNEKK